MLSYEVDAKNIIEQVLVENLKELQELLKA